MGGFAQEFIGGILTLIVYALIFAGVYKVFQMSTDLTEIKDLLRDIRRNTEDHLKPLVTAQAAQPTTNQSPEELLRALREQNYSLDYAADDPHPATPSLSDPPR